MRTRLSQRMLSEQRIQYLCILPPTSDRSIRILPEYPEPSTPKNKKSELAVLEVRGEENVDELNLQNRGV